jgi:hypothetical protein
MWKYAKRIDPSATPLTGRINDYNEEPSVLAYRDTASTRAEIVPITAKLENHRIAIVGLGGTGSYVLDFVAKTPVKEIRLYDGDRFSQHNAFRAPGATHFEGRVPPQHLLRGAPQHHGVSAVPPNGARGVRVLGLHISLHR